MADAPTPPSKGVSQNVGEWSNAVDGLRGRLCVQVLGETNAKQDFQVYLDLQNISKTGASRDVFFSVDGVVWTLTDEAGRSAEEVPVSLIAPFDIGAWMTLPAGSTKRWWVSGGSYNGGSGLDMRYRSWIISPDKTKRYFVSALFSDADPKVLNYIHPTPPSALVARNNIWRGKIVLPKVAVPRDRGGN